MFHEKFDIVKALEYQQKNNPAHSSLNFSVEEIIKLHEWKKELDVKYCNRIFTVTTPTFYYQGNKHSIFRHYGETHKSVESLMSSIIGYLEMEDKMLFVLSIHCCIHYNSSNMQHEKNYNINYLTV